MKDQKDTIFVGAASTLECRLLTAALVRSHIKVVGAASSSSEVISGVSRQKPHAALISSRLQDGDRAGLVVLREVLTLTPDLRAIMLVDPEESELVMESFRAGAAGVFSRCNGPSELRPCIRAVLEGKPWVSHTDVLSLIDAVRSKSREDHSSARATVALGEGLRLLTRREEDVVQLLLSGMTNRAMATHLKLSQHTIKNYFFSIFEKVGVSNRVELLLYAMSRRKTPTPITSRPEECVTYMQRPHSQTSRVS
jgi:DNA-binding NarL/FixJ family response regulator